MDCKVEEEHFLTKRNEAYFLCSLPLLKALLTNRLLIHTNKGTLLLWFYINKVTYRRSFLAERSRYISRHKTSFTAVHFAQKDNFQVRFLLHYMEKQINTKRKSIIQQSAKNEALLKALIWRSSSERRGIRHYILNC